MAIQPDAPNTVEKNIVKVESGHPSYLQTAKEKKDEEEPKPKPHPVRTKVRTWMPDEEVDLAMGKSGIEAKEPMTVGQLFKDAVDRLPKHPALKYEENGKWKTFTYTEYYHHCIRAAKSFLKVRASCIFMYNYSKSDFIL